MTSSKTTTVALCLALLVSSCDEPEPLPWDGEVTLEVGYELDFAQEEFSTSFVTNLGYEVTLDALVIANYNVELIPCPTTTSLFDLIIPAARAGHPQETSPLAAPRREYEAWHLPGQITSMGTRDFSTSSQTSFCHVHYLVARSDDTFASSTYEPEVDMNRLSLFVEGTWRRGKEPPTPLRIESAINYGKHIPLSGGPLTLDAREVTITVTLTRQRGALLDDVDLAIASEQDVARALLRHIIDQTLARVVPRSH